MIWIGYTTRYRTGGARLARAARTMAREKAATHGPAAVRCEAVESKREVLAAMDRIQRRGERLDELHLLSHSGMYGPMFGTTAWPEQFSPHEWRSLRLPFAPGGAAFFHACRTARWFAPFFARTFEVPTHGFHWYTTFSARPDRFAWAGPWRAGSGAHAPLYLLGCPGRKSHGLLGSALKYGGAVAAETMKRFEPAPPEGDPSYDGVADLYDEVFDDIRVRQVEWTWLERRVRAAGAAQAGHGLRLLDICCGNGALLEQLASRLASGAGVDASPAMVRLARRRLAAAAHLDVRQVDGPALPFPDDSFDLAVSLLSFRYLDWDPLMAELRRVLAPGGRLLVVDMVAAPARVKDLARFARGKAGWAWERVARRGYRRALRRLVSDPRWASMLRHNPIRAEHELRWYLESRFPGRRVELLDLGWHHRVLGFDSGPFEVGRTVELSYP